MTIYVGACVAGLFAFDEKKRLVAQVIFPNNPEAISEKLDKWKSGEKIPELDEISKKVEGKLDVNEPNLATEILKINFRDYAQKYGFVKSQGELNKIISKVSLQKSKKTISGLEKRDKLIIQAVAAVTDLEKMTNTMIERLREWYGLHYPELKIQNHKRYAELVHKNGRRENFKEFKSSVGMDISDDDIKILKEYAERVEKMYEIKEDAVKYLEKVIPSETPNLNALLGTMLAGRILVHAGSLEKLAKMPSSKIQLLGAEKALFKFLKGREHKTPPKYGIIFTHPDIHSAPREKKGKIARLLAAKLTLAARADFYTKKDISADLVKDYQEKKSKV